MWVNILIIKGDIKIKLNNKEVELTGSSTTIKQTKKFKLPGFEIVSNEHIKEHVIEVVGQGNEDSIF